MKKLHMSENVSLKKLSLNDEPLSVQLPNHGGKKVVQNSSLESNSESEEKVKLLSENLCNSI